MRNAFSRLEGGAFQLKEQRSRLRILERVDLPTISAEQRLQLDGSVPDDTAVRVGKLLGADSVLLFRIEFPSLRERLFAEAVHDLPPITISSKILLIESAEIVFHNIVLVPLAEKNEKAAFGRDRFALQSLLRAALEKGVTQTIADLQRAFR